MKRKCDDPLSITRAAVWIESHKKKSGDPINEFAKEKIEKLNKAKSSIACGKDDALSQVFGPKPPGRVRAVGFGITSSTLFGVQQSSAKLHQVEEEMKVLKNEVSSMKEMLAKFVESQQNQSASQPCPEPPCEDQTPSTQSNRLSNGGGVNSSKNVKCKLFRLIPEDVVAHGYWCTDDPTTLVRHVPLGHGMSKVLIEAVVQGGALLVRKNDELQTIEDAVGSFVAWPTNSLFKE